MYGEMEMTEAEGEGYDEVNKKNVRTTIDNQTNGYRPHTHTHNTHTLVCTYVGLIALLVNHKERAFIRLLCTQWCRIIEFAQELDSGTLCIVQSNRAAQFSALNFQKMSVATLQCTCPIKAICIHRFRTSVSQSRPPKLLLQSLVIQTIYNLQTLHIFFALIWTDKENWTIEIVAQFDNLFSRRKCCKCHSREDYLFGWLVIAGLSFVGHLDFESEKLHPTMAIFMSISDGFRSIHLDYVFISIASRDVFILGFSLLIFTRFNFKECWSSAPHLLSLTQRQFIFCDCIKWMVSLKAFTCASTCVSVFFQLKWMLTFWHSTCGLRFVPSPSLVSKIFYCCDESKVFQNRML